MLCERLTTQYYDISGGKKKVLHRHPFHLPMCFLDIPNVFFLVHFGLVMQRWINNGKPGKFAYSLEIKNLYCIC